MDAMLRARGDRAAAQGSQGGKIRISNLQARFSTFNTGGSLITTSENADPNEETTFPNAQGFDHMESYFVGFPSPTGTRFPQTMTVDYVRVYQISE